MLKIIEYLKNRNKDTYYHRKVVEQYKRGKLINEYQSLAEIQIKKGYRKSHISEVCNGKRPSAYGYIWKFKVKEK